jgi:hypothetical protein
VRVRLLLSLVLVLAVLASPAGAAELKRHSVGDGMSLTVPDSWVAMNARQLVSNAALDQLARENPKLAPFVRQFVQSGSPVKFIAVDPSLRGGFASNVNVVSLPLPGNIPIEQYRAALVGQVRAVGGARIAASVVRIGGQPAVRLSYRLRLTVGQPVTVQTLQYAFVRSRKGIVVTYSTLPRLAGSYARTFQASAASIRFGR